MIKLWIISHNLCSIFFVILPITWSSLWPVGLRPLQSSLIYWWIMNVALCNLQVKMAIPACIGLFSFLSKKIASYIRCCGNMFSLLSFVTVYHSYKNHNGLISCRILRQMGNILLALIGILKFVWVFLLLGSIFILLKYIIHINLTVLLHQQVTAFPTKPLDGAHEIQSFCLGHTKCVSNNML